MENDHIRIEIVAGEAWEESVSIPIFIRARTSLRWLCIYALFSPLQFLYYCLVVIPVSLRLALAKADKVIFVFATSILSFYQVPRKVFYIYMAILVVTGLFQFLGNDSVIRIGLLDIMDAITIGKANLFLRKYSSFHYSNPYTRLLTSTRTLFIPVGCIVPGRPHKTIEVFDFPVSNDLRFNRKVGDCTIVINTLSSSSVVRFLQVQAPWGDKGVTFSMVDEDLGRFISYLDHVAASTKCDQVICTHSQVICTHSRYRAQCRALTIVETIEHFNRGLSLVKLEQLGDDYYFIN